MTDPNSPQINAAAPTAGSSSSSSFFGFLDQNKWWILVGFALLGIGLILYYLLSNTTRSRRLQRDALEKLRKSLLESCRATRGPAKSVWLTGSPRDPTQRIGSYLGHHHGLECVWIAYRPGLFRKARVVCVNPVDLNGLDVPELHLRAKGLQVTRDLTFAVPDTHDPTERARWARTAGHELATSERANEAVKAYWSRAVDNAIAFYDALNAAEDRSFLRQEVTRSQNELTETITAPAQPTPPTGDTTEA